VLHEANYLYLDSSKARGQLGWTPTWDLTTCLEQTAQWYRAVARDPASAREISERQLERFCQ
jgi:CDP-glucose 4,6-dehydratase